MAANYQKYLLTDGAEVFAIRFMTESKAREANTKAKKATDGNLYWRTEGPSDNTYGQPNY